MRKQYSENYRNASNGFVGLYILQKCHIIGLSVDKWDK